MQTVEFAFGANSIVHETLCELQYLSGTHCISQVRQSMVTTNCVKLQ